MYVQNIFSQTQTVAVCGKRIALKQKALAISDIII